MKKLFTLFTALIMAVAVNAQDAPLYTAVGHADVFDWDGWDPATCMFTDVKDIKVEVYNGYTILRDWCGAKGYDICLIHPEGTSLEWATPTEAYNIINGQEVDPYSADGFCYVSTGRTDYTTAAVYMSYCYISTDADYKEGELILCQFVYDEDDNSPENKYYYYIVWGEDEAESKVTIWKNDGSVGTLDWGNVNVRLGCEGTDGGNECTATIPADIWSKMKTTPFRAQLTNFTGDWQCIRVTDGWWSINYRDMEEENDIDLLQTDEDGNKYIEIDLSTSPLLNTIDEKHLLFTGANCVVDEVYFPADASASISAPTATPLVKTGTYNLAGQKVSANYKGIVIRDGKKIFVK